MQSPSIPVLQDTRVILPPQEHRGPLWLILAQSAQQEVIAQEPTTLRQLVLQAISVLQAPNTRHNTHAHQAHRD